MTLGRRGTNNRLRDLRVIACPQTRLERLLYAPILTRVKSQNRHPATRIEAVGEMAQQRIER